MLEWLRGYRRRDLAGDVGAGIVVAMMMIPQGMAYALVAGLPPVVGLYASIAPPLLYALFGTSSTQSVGPMAIISLMTASALAPLAAPGGSLYVILAAQLAALAGAVLLACGLLRIGFLANFFSRPVMNGFTLGSAVVIALGQVDTVLGAPMPYWHGPSSALGLGAIAFLLAARACRRAPRTWARGWRRCCSCWAAWRSSPCATWMRAACGRSGRCRPACRT